MRIILSLALSLSFSLLAYSSQAFETLAKQAVLVDYESGEVLFEKSSVERMAPSSMSKLMTIYVVFEKLKNGSLKMDDKFTVSQKAWSTQGSKMFVPVGEQVKVEDLLQGVIVQSGNDACIVFAEGISGTEDEFANLLNKKAEEIGLKNSHFVNSNGWPDDNHYMTAMDLAILARRLISDFPEYYHYFSQKEYSYNNITQQNRNVILGKDLGVDGLKTGHTEAGGFGITISGKKDDLRLVVVVNGLSSMAERAGEAEKMLRWGLLNYESKKIATKDAEVLEAPVWMGADEKVKVGLTEDLKITAPRHNAGEIKLKALYSVPIIAPVKKGAKIGELVITLSDNRVIKRDLVARDEVAEKTGFKRFAANLKYKLVPYKPAI